jgi:hypothetical protein
VAKDIENFEAQTEAFKHDGLGKRETWEALDKDRKAFKLERSVCW